jgi:hypothetical protein
MIKAKTWNGRSLTGTWVFSIKLDGVRGLYTGDQWMSRADKPLYNLPKPAPDIFDAEIFCGTFKETIQATRTHNAETIDPRCIYSIEPLDPRLKIGEYENPTSEFIYEQMLEMIKRGHEGLILRQGKVWLKVKPEETYDVPIIEIIEGTKKSNKGQMGTVKTPMGNVSAGFSKDERSLVWNNPDRYLNALIEVSCLQLTTDGKFRHPRFKRFRFDK